MSPVQDISPDSIPDDIGTPGKGDSVDTVDLGGLELSGSDLPEGPQQPPAPKAEEPEGDEPAAEPEGEEQPDEAAEYTEADLVKELNLGEYATVKEALEARESENAKQVDGLKTLFAKAGIDLLGNNLQEIQQELEWRLTHNSSVPQGPTATQPDVPSQAQPLKLDDVFAKYQDKLDLDDTQKSLFADMIGAAVAQRQGQLSPALQQISAVPNAVQLLLDHQWYNDAKASAGDAPIPSLEDARRLLNANPKLREWASQRQEIFGDMNANPMKDIFAQWAGAKNSLGLTNAEVQKRNEQAVKTRNFKRTLTPGAVPRAKPKTNSQMSNKELGETMHNIPIQDAFPRG